MSTFPAADVHPAYHGRTGLFAPSRVAAAAACLSILTLCSVWTSAVAVWTLWMGDPLKSIGLFIPLVSFVLVLRAWRAQGWQLEGSWWGLVLLLATIATVRLRDQAVLVLVLTPHWFLYFPPHSLVAVCYAASMVLLFGGVRLLRAAWFPVALMWFVNPVPHIFNLYVDLPLQRASAHVARGFAMALGQPLTHDQLRLMFTPEFGMFIAPGCNGIRGAITMGFIALIAGYLYRFRLRAHIAVTVAAVLLGYVFNLLRLCTLVLYYLVALHIPWLQSRAEMGDYIIGAILFLIATYLLFQAIRRLSSAGAGQAAEPEAVADTSVSTAALLRVGAVGIIGLASLGVLAHTLVHSRAVAQLAAQRAEQASLGEFPLNVGGYHLVRNWNETVDTGALLYHWAEYAPAGDGPHVSLGVSPFMGAHDTLICHSARGEEPLWHDQLNLVSADQASIVFSGAFFNSGVSQYLDATTVCNTATCGEFASDHLHFGFVYSKVDPAALLHPDPVRPIPILIRAETLDTQMLPDTARAQLTASVRDFVASIHLQQLTQTYRHA
ncbi:MAG: exosortase J [Acidobacteriota bacterium]|nr:exosortase J [Acidobacteriota bacterium]